MSNNGLAPPLPGILFSCVLSTTDLLKLCLLLLGSRLLLGLVGLQYSNSLFHLRSSNRELIQGSYALTHWALFSPENVCFITAPVLLLVCAWRMFFSGLTEILYNVNYSYMYTAIIYILSLNVYTTQKFFLLPLLPACSFFKFYICKFDTKKSQIKYCTISVGLEVCRQTVNAADLSTL